MNTNKTFCDEEEIIAKVRNQLRLEKNYQMSDFIRDEMAKSGITVQDKKL